MFIYKQQQQQQQKPWEDKDLKYNPVNTSDSKDEYIMLQIMHGIGRHYNNLPSSYLNGIDRVEGDHINIFICIYHPQNYLTIFS